MKDLTKRLLKHPLIQGSAIVVAGNLFANFFNFLFNLFMSRNLSVENYGILAAITTLVGLPVFISNAISPMVIRFAGDNFAKNRLDLARGLYIKITKVLVLITVVVFIFFLIFLGQIGEFFHIEDHKLLFLTSLIIAHSILGTVNYVFLYAKLAFKSNVSALILMAIVKLLVGIGLIFLGYSIGGAVMAILVSALVAYVFTFIPLKFVFDRKAVNAPIDTSELFRYGIPSALTLFGLTTLLSADILLVKHFFDPQMAGIYAGLALVAKVIFYIAAPIGSVMFPIIIQKHARNENTTNTFLMSMFLVLGAAISMTGFYYLFPEFTLLFFLKKEEYLLGAGLLGYFGISVSLYCIATILANFYLSIKKTSVYIPVVIAALSQIILIVLFHESFFQVITITLIVTFLLNVILLVYYPYAVKKN